MAANAKKTRLILFVAIAVVLTLFVLGGLILFNSSPPQEEDRTRISPEEKEKNIVREKKRPPRMEEAPSERTQHGDMKESRARYGLYILRNHLDKLQETHDAVTGFAFLDLRRFADERGEFDQRADRVEDYHRAAHRARFILRLVQWTADPDYLPHDYLLELRQAISQHVAFSGALQSLFEHLDSSYGRWSYYEEAGMIVFHEENDLKLYYEGINDLERILSPGSPWEESAP